jgi:hypothetical protein
LIISYIQKQQIQKKTRFKKQHISKNNRFQKTDLKNNRFKKKTDLKNNRLKKPYFNNIIFPKTTDSEKRQIPKNNKFQKTKNIKKQSLTAINEGTEKTTVFNKQHISKSTLI